MKKIILALILVSVLALPLIGFADTPTTTLPEYDVMKTLVNIADWLFAILMIIAVIFLVLGALQYITAAGDPEKVKLAGEKVKWALIGVIVALLARGLVSLIEKFMVS